MTLVLGLDVGGTSSRALITTLDGARAGFGRAGAGNPVSVPLADAVASVADAVRAALSGLDPSEVRSAVMGIAGTGRFADPVVAAAFGQAFAGLGLTVPVRPVGDVLVAYAAGTAEPSGSVLISGTGAIAARIDAGEMTGTADGIGWLLGDLGSGFWLGREAAALTARELYTRVPQGRLTRSVATTVLGTIPAAPSRQAADDLIGALHAEPPRHLSRLAPLVTDAAAHGDPQALALVDRAAAHLTECLAEVHTDGPVVLAGSVLTTSAPVRDALIKLLADRLPGTAISVAGPGETGAARLAARLVT
ncbi:N-acetylglucosamine kinase [Catellatospora chokoriensis]|uniref:N-acetylglucosamine kinase n=1 Tax=Catellatospora chokoriensis TaxID=310353 RepID=A0A8J3K4R1_9ACTN|nr:BadF/BadG/BcrA/BcrD ATPase family protein [Catellatospora chokoriensis]GIF89464.1 N-acetylglucosamine kinase [Catellatospora chokoriensis]